MLTLIRHGESHANVNGKLYDYEIDSVISLTEKGVLDTLNLAKDSDLHGTFSRVLCSPLHRAQQTAAILGEMDFFNMGIIHIDNDLYELTTAVSLEDMDGYLKDPFYIPEQRTVPMVYGGMVVGHPVSLSFVDAICQALCRYEDNTLIIAHHLRIQAIMASNAVVSFYKDFSISKLRENAKELITLVFNEQIEHTKPYVIVNEKLSPSDKKEITQLLCSLGNSN